MIFLSCYVPQERIEQTSAQMKVQTSNAVNRFQWSLLEGFLANGINNLNILNALPVGSWPRHHRQLYLKRHESTTPTGTYSEVPTINIPILKQLSRYFVAMSYLRKHKDKEILIYSTYLPFLAAATSKRFSRNTTLIVTDLPEYYDLTRNQSSIRKAVRRVISRMTYHYIERVDRFVLLTQEMHEVLKVGNRPYTIVEGIAPISLHDTVDNRTGDNQEKHDKTILLYSGSLTIRFGCLDLLKVLEAISDENLELWICGSGEGEEMILEYQKRDSRLKYFGFLSVEEVMRLQRMATILVNPRKPEGDYTKYSFPSKTMEYMLSGKPVVMYKLPGIPDEYDEHLFYIPDDMPGAIGKTVASVLKMSTEELEAKSNAAKQFIINRKDAAIQARKILEIISYDRKGCI